MKVDFSSQLNSFFGPADWKMKQNYGPCKCAAIQTIEKKKP